MDNWIDTLADRVDSKTVADTAIAVVAGYGARKAVEKAAQVVAVKAAAAAGAAVGSNVAASSVTVLGSATLGKAALALRLVSAPVTPVIVGTVAAPRWDTWHSAASARYAEPYCDVTTCYQPYTYNFCTVKQTP